MVKRLLALIFYRVATVVCQPSSSANRSGSSCCRCGNGRVQISQFRTPTKCKRAAAPTLRPRYSRRRFGAFAVGNSYYRCGLWKDQKAARLLAAFPPTQGVVGMLSLACCDRRLRQIGYYPLSRPLRVSIGGRGRIEVRSNPRNAAAGRLRCKQHPCRIRRARKSSTLHLGQFGTAKIISTIAD